MDINDYLVGATVIITLFFFGGAAVLAFSWAVKNGEFENFQRAANSIFDEDEPIGRTTDHFPNGPGNPQA